MRRGVGVGAIKNRSIVQSRYDKKKQEIADNESANLSRQLEDVKMSLEAFASKYQSKIRQDEKFRSQFQSMCANIGVDPLASSCGYWSKILGLGDFYYHLAVRIIEVCMANQRRTGGLLPLSELVTELNRTKSSKDSNVASDDVIRAIKKLRCLGSGFTLIELSDSRQLVQSVPGDLNMDHTSVLSLAESKSGYTSVPFCVKKLEWTAERAQSTLSYMMKEGIAWIDKSEESADPNYWFPSLFKSKTSN